MIDRKTDMQTVQTALKRGRVVGILGPRQCGKTNDRLVGEISVFLKLPPL